MSNPKGKPRSIFKSLSGFNRVLLLFGLGIPLDVATGSIKVNLRNRIGFLVSLSCAVFAMGIALYSRLVEEWTMLHRPGIISISYKWHSCCLSCYSITLSGDMFRSSGRKCTNSMIHWRKWNGFGLSLLALGVVVTSKWACSCHRFHCYYFFSSSWKSPTK